MLSGSSRGDKLPTEIMSFVPLGNGGRFHLVPDGTPSDEFVISGVGKDALRWDVRADEMGSFKLSTGEWLHDLQGEVYVSVGTVSPTGEAEYRDGNTNRGSLDFFDEIVPEDADRLENEYHVVLHVTPQIFARLAEFALHGKFPTVKVEAVQVDVACMQGKQTEEWKHRAQQYVRIAWFEFHYTIGSTTLADGQDDEESEDEE